MRIDIYLTIVLLSIWGLARSQNDPVKMLNNLIRLNPRLVGIDEAIHINMLEEIDEEGEITSDMMCNLEKPFDSERTQHALRFYVMIRILVDSATILKELLPNLIQIYKHYYSFVEELSCKTKELTAPAIKHRSAERIILEMYVQNIQEMEKRLKTSEAFACGIKELDLIEKLVQVDWTKEYNYYIKNKKSNVLNECYASLKRLSSHTYSMHVTQMALDTILNSHINFLNGLQQHNTTAIISPASCKKGSCIICKSFDSVDIMKTHKKHIPWSYIAVSLPFRVSMSFEEFFSVIGPETPFYKIDHFKKEISFGDYKENLLCLYNKSILYDKEYNLAVTSVLKNNYIRLESMLISDFHIDGINQVLYQIKKSPIMGTSSPMWENIRKILIIPASTIKNHLKDVSPDVSIAFYDLSKELIFFSYVFKDTMCHFFNTYFLWIQSSVSDHVDAMNNFYVRPKPALLKNMYHAKEYYETRAFDSLISMHSTICVLVRILKKITDSIELLDIVDLKTSPCMQPE
ncbi:hypothetical protein NERG_00084 [Nematocida ausubeli]|uniref:Uncharacterized protein n=1 Tax=Nematocida ausubeli (strain ATCC PRA-371 / ERTm2) TaxID=1913371 RepID=H8Z913_NEMA1|nr:hypothetical protein NERG_00084 [Nematocida ausubeli]